MWEHLLATASPESPTGRATLDAFRQGLCELGYVEGQNIVIEYRWAQGRVERFPELAAEEGRSMERFEYRFVEVNFLDGTGDKTLNELGGQGWKVVDSRPHPNSQYMSVVLLERQKAS